jgi:hypothetical protein
MENYLLKTPKKLQKNAFVKMLNGILAILILSFFTVQSAFSQTLVNQSANLDQVRNGGASAPNDPGNWVNGNANAVQAHYSEGWSIPYRMVMEGLSIGTHKLVIEWDTKDNGKHAIDYITSYNNLDYPVDSHAGFGHAPETIDPTIGITGLGAPSTFPIPAPGSVGASVAGQPTLSFNNLPNSLKLMTIYNGTITSIVYAEQQDLGPKSTKSSVEITFTNTSSKALIAWGGHIAAEYDWGLGEGATSINGSPYHTRLISLDGSGGNQDRQLAASAVFIPVRCSIAGPGDLCPTTSPVSYTSTILNQNASTVTYLWTLENNTAGAVISGSNTGSSINVIPSGAKFYGGGSFNVKLTVTRDGISHTCYLGSDVSPGNLVNVGWCNPEIICTYTLDFYGNEPETACGANGDQIATVATMSSALSTVGGTKVFGLPINNQTFTLAQADIAVGGNIFTMLPGTKGPSAALIGNNSYSGVAIDNSLLAHTMVLFFNLQTSASLGSLAITNNMWTQAVDCTTGIPFGPNVLTQMPASIISYLFNGNNGYPQTIAGLFAVANDALGGKDLGDENVIVIPNFDDIKTAIERINAAFNECRRLVPAPINATGFIYNDDDGMSDGIIDFVPGSPLNGPALGGVYLTLIEGSDIDINGNNTGQILKVAEISATGQYLFDPVVNGTYTINMGTNPAGDRKPVAPNGKVFTGEGGNVINGYALGDGVPNGRIVMTVKDNDPPIFLALKVAAPMATLNDLNYGIADAVLPVKLLYFEGKKVESGNELNWKTAREVNFSHFEIEKSQNAQTFELIGKVISSTNTNKTETQAYSFIDNNSTGESYYRLKMVDSDGSSKYSNIVFIKAEKQKSFVGEFYPNPATENESTIIINSSLHTNWSITSIDMGGRILNTENKVLIIGENKVKVKIDKLRVGTNIIRFENADGVQYRKIIK